MSDKPSPSWHSQKYRRNHPESAPVEKKVEQSEPSGIFYYTWPMPMGIAVDLRKLWASPFWKRLRKKKEYISALIGLLASFASWGYSVLNPEPNVYFGMFLIFLSGVCLVLLTVHILELKWLGTVVASLVVLALFAGFSKKVVISPTYKRELEAQLQEGYNLRDECGSRQYYDDAPRFMGDSEERWMARVQTILTQAGKVDDSQIWEQSELVGLAKDGNKIGFRCTRMAIKTAALETIISRHYDSQIRPNPFNGPVYVLDPQKGGMIKLPGSGSMVVLSTP